MNSFTCAYRVSYRDCTVGDHIYYSRYLEILEVARGEFFRHAGLSLRHLQEQGVTFPVVECRMRYHAMAQYDDELKIRVWLTQLRGARLNFGCRIETEAGRLVLEAETCHACADLASKPRRLPPELLERLGPWLSPELCQRTDAGGGPSE